MTYAIIKTGGKQYSVKVGDEIKVEKLSLEEGDTLTLNEVLMLKGEEDTQVGKPYLEDVSVIAEVVENGKGKKIIVFKKKRRKKYRSKRGHRQEYTKLRIKEIKCLK